MTARDCLTKKMSRGVISSRAGTEVLAVLRELEDDYKPELGDSAAARKAAFDAAELLKIVNAQRINEIRDAALTQKKLLATYGAYDRVTKTLRAEGEAPFHLGRTIAKGEARTTAGAAFSSILARDIYDIATHTNVVSSRRFLEGKMHRLLAETIYRLRSRRLGFKAARIDEHQLLKAGYGEPDVSPTGKVDLDAYREVDKFMTDEFRAAKGVMPKRENYFPSFAWDPNRLRGITFDAFLRLIAPHVNRTKMVDFVTGKPLSESRFRKLAHDAFEAIQNDGAEGPASAARKGYAMLAKQRMAARFFEWNGADSWMAMAEMFGTHASPYRAMIEHLEGLAIDTAMLRHFGMNPQASKRFIDAFFDREANKLVPKGEAPSVARQKLSEKVEDRVNTQKYRFESLWNEVSGSNQLPANMTWARRGALVRSFLQFSQLGSAIFSAIGDPFMAVMTARLNGLSGLRVLRTGIRNLLTRGSEVQMAQLEMVIDTLSHGLGDGDRLIGQHIRTANAMNLGPAMIRAQGLRKWTAAWRGAYWMEAMAYATRQAVEGKNWDKLEPAFKRGLQRYGFERPDWHHFRDAEPYRPKPDAPFTRPSDIDDGVTPSTRAAAEKFSQWLTTEQDHAVINQDPVARAMVRGDRQPGTVVGEVAASVTMYRNWPATYMLTHLARALNRGWNGSRMGHAAITFLGMTILGAISFQLKSVLLFGKDPASLDPTSEEGRNAWMRGVLQGGGLGIFGDILLGQENAYGQSWAATAIGPVFGLAEDILGDFILTNIRKAVRGEETDFIGDALYLAGRYFPGASFWPTRLVFQREVMDQLHLWADPDARDRFRRMERTAEHDYGQEYWFPPGERAPERAPNLGAVFGGR